MKLRILHKTGGKMGLRSLVFSALWQRCATLWAQCNALVDQRDSLGMIWTCHGLVPDTYLIYAANLSNARGLLPPSVECLRRGL